MTEPCTLDPSASQLNLHSAAREVRERRAEELDAIKRDKRAYGKLQTATAEVSRSPPRPPLRASMHPRASPHAASHARVIPCTPLSRTCAFCSYGMQEVGCCVALCSSKKHSRLFGASLLLPHSYCLTPTGCR